MSFGIAVSNSGGSVQIDNLYVAYRVVSRGVLANPASLPWPTSEDKVMLVRCAASVGDLYVDRFGTTSDPITKLSGDGGVEYVLLQRSNTVAPSSDPYGFRVFGNAGQVIYDSGSQPMVPVATGKIQGPAVTVYPPYSAAHGRKRYINAGIFARPYALMQVTINYGRFLTARASIGSSEITLGLEWRVQGPPQESYPSEYNIDFMIADA